MSAAGAGPGCRVTECLVPRTCGQSGCPAGVPGAARCPAQQLLLQGGGEYVPSPCEMLARPAGEGLNSSGVERELEAGCHGSQEFLGEFLPCLWVSVEPYLPPKRLSARHC